MKITQRTTYLVDNGEFKTIDNAKQHIENRLGTIIDSSDNSHELPHKKKLRILKMLIDNKELLCKLLDVQLEIEDNALQSHYINILDY